MKKAILLLIILAGAAGVQAQNINPEFDYVPGSQKKSADRQEEHKYKYGGVRRSDWGVEVNATGGFLMQKVATNDFAANYLNAVNKNISEVKYRNGLSRGIDAELDYFFGANKEFGVGAGIMYMRQNGDLYLDNFHVEYQSADAFGNTYRQVLTANGSIRESIRTSNLNIPLLFKYRTGISEKIGFTADAGLLFNVREENHYKTDASFDYEAIYQYTNGEGPVRTAYDNAPTPAAGDLLITKEQYLGNHSQASIQDYFNTLRTDGYNVGLGVTPTHGKGEVVYNGGSLGIFIRPAVSLCLAQNLVLNVGVYYAYQNFNHDAAANYRLTDRLGEYNSLVNNVTTASNHSFGVSVGLRYSLFNSGHVFLHNGVRKEKTKEVEPEQAREQDTEQEQVTESPEISPVDIEHEPTPDIDISTPILFDVDKTHIPPAAYPQLEVAVRKLAENKKSTLVINGYADNTGKEKANVRLSKKRAQSVKTYLTHKGVYAKRMTTIGHGSKNPAASNKTAEGRARNRRVIMKLKTAK